MSLTLLILKINTTFEDVQMMLKWFFDFIIGFRISKISVECSDHICSCPCITWIPSRDAYTHLTYILDNFHGLKKFNKSHLIKNLRFGMPFRDRPWSLLQNREFTQFEALPSSFSGIWFAYFPSRCKFPSFSAFQFQTCLLFTFRSWYCWITQRDIKLHELLMTKRIKVINIQRQLIKN